jgi:hypothetical protein
MKVFGYLEGVPLFFKELLCNLSILELCSMLTFCTWCVLLFCYDILRHLDITLILVGPVALQRRHFKVHQKEGRPRGQTPNQGFKGMFTSNYHNV